MSDRALSRVILFAEDDTNDIALLERVVKREFPSSKLLTVPDGGEAIRYLEGAAEYGDRSRFPLPNLVLLDIKMPKVDGLKVLSWIRQHPGFRGLIVLILTNSDSQDHVREAYDLHANSFLKKRPLLVVPQISKGILEYWLAMNELPHV